MMHTVWVGVLAFVIDRLTKVWAVSWLRVQPGGTYALWPGVLHLTYVQNTGMAFSLLENHTWLLALITPLALLLVVVALKYAMRCTTLQNALLWLLLAGGAGNLVDRVFYGYVVDFLEIRLFRFAIFNFSDMYLTLAALFLIIALLLTKEEKDEKRGAA